MASAFALNLSENGYIPDSLIRHGIKRLLRQRLEGLDADNTESQAEQLQDLLIKMSQSHIAEHTDEANQQHYELPSAFFEQVLGEHLKYSCGDWSGDIKSLDLAERQALIKTCKRAQLVNGQDILELGCGWGSLTIWMAQHYPGSQITAVSNSASQKAHIDKRAAAAQLTNVRVITADMNNFDTPETYDRIVSVEMFEHMRQWQKLYERVSHWLKPDGLFFKHIFVHQSTPYFFEDENASDWMSRHFFTGGMMPSAQLPLHFQDHLKVERHWFWNGTHYEKTSNAWLQNMDAKADDLWPLFEEVYGKDFAQVWWMRWRMFFMACAELFGYNDGQEWFVGHYLFSKR